MEQTNQNHDIQIGGRGRRIRKSGAAALLLGGAALALSPAVAGAVTGTGSTQTTTFTPNAQLSIAASPVALGNTAVSNVVPVSLSSVVVTDTEADSVNWSASVAASNCFLPTSGLPATLNTANATLPATALSYDAGSGTKSPTVALTTGTPAAATLGGTNPFGAATGGTLASPTFGTPITVASTSVSSGTFSSGPLNNDGTYTITPSLNLNLSSTSSFVAVAQLYTCTLQYTITG